ncbi:PqqD family protein [Modestobacter versicolor]|uniref:PqqD family protein n=1 Tax=Modestobacter versicolor TaxID=429133 RepID=UPI0034DF3C7D
MTEGGDQIRFRPGAVSWREADGEVIVLDLRTSDYLGVNRAGSVLWTAIAGGTTEAALVDALQEAFGLDRARAESDVAAFLADARSRDVLEG